MGGIITSMTSPPHPESQNRDQCQKACFLVVLRNVCASACGSRSAKNDLTPKPWSTELSKFESGAH